MDRNRVHHARATSNLEALFPSLCHFTFKKALEYEISCFCGMIYARQWCVGYWGGGGGSGGIAIKLGHKTEYTFECFKVHAKTRRRKKKQANKQQLHTPIKNHNISFQLKLLYLNSALLLGGVCIVRLGV